MLVYLEEACADWDKGLATCLCLLGDIDYVLLKGNSYYCHLEAHCPVEEGK